MADTTLLEQIRTIVRGEIQAETKIMKVDMQGMKAEILDIKQTVVRIEQKLEREVTDLAENITEIMTGFDVVDDMKTAYIS